MIIRIYAGDDGESHFEDLTADQFADIANDVGPGDITVGQRPAGWWQDYHTAPRHQYVVFMSGGAEIEVASGEKRQFGPGDVSGRRGPHRPWAHHSQRRRGTPGVAGRAPEMI